MTQPQTDLAYLRSEKPKRSRSCALASTGRRSLNARCRSRTGESVCIAFAPVLECFLVCPGELADDQVIHFTGYDVKNILTYHGIPLDQHVFYSGTLPEYKMLFRKSSGNCSSASMAMRTILPRCSTRSCFLSAASSRKVKMWRSTFRKKSKPPLPTLTRTITPKSAWRTMQNRCTSAQTGSSETSQAVYENKPCAVHPVASDGQCAELVGEYRL